MSVREVAVLTSLLTNTRSSDDNVVSDTGNGDGAGGGIVGVVIYDSQAAAQNLWLPCMEKRGPGDITRRYLGICQEDRNKVYLQMALTLKSTKQTKHTGVSCVLC